MVGQSVARPAQHGRAHVEALPAGGVVLHQPRVQEARDELAGPRGLQHLVHVNPVEPVAVGLVRALPVQTQLRGGQELVLRDAAEVEQEAQGRVPLLRPL